MDRRGRVHRDTFASIWAKGKVRDSGINLEIFSKQTDPLWRGLEIDDNISEYHELVDLPPYILMEVNNMIEDAVKYVEWTLKWPEFVQIVRSVTQGKFAGDLSYSNSI